MGWLSMLIERLPCVCVYDDFPRVDSYFATPQVQLSTSTSFVLYLACLVTINTLRIQDPR